MLLGLVLGSILGLKWKVKSVKILVLIWTEKLNPRTGRSRAAVGPPSTGNRIREAGFARSTGFDAGAGAGVNAVHK